jgi:hypothetical protein
MNSFHATWAHAKWKLRLSLEPPGMAAASSRARPGKVLLERIQGLYRSLCRSHSPRFTKYQPASRLGTRRVEQRLLLRLSAPRVWS